MGSEKLTELIRTAQAEIEEAGYCFGLYTACTFIRKAGLTRHLRLSSVIARYPSTSQTAWADSPPEQYKPSVGRTIWGWQWTSNGRLPGISGAVDFDICYQDPGEWAAPEKEPA